MLENPASCFLPRRSAMEFRTLYLLGVLLLTAARLAEASQTIYEVLKQNGLPVGLLPKAVESYNLGDDGSFEVTLTKPCYAKFESQVYYERTVRGILSYGQIAGLSGVQAQELFLWFPVRGIRVDVPSSGFIYFDVGVIYKQYSLSLFESPPDCKEKGDYVATEALQ